MQIKEAATQLKISPRSLRHYEQTGLLSPARDANGYRAFRESEMHKLAFLGRARTLGFSIEDCRNLLALWEDKNRASADVRAIAKDHLAQIEAKISGLQEMRDTLSTLVRDCAGDDRPDCPILKTLGTAAAI